MPKITALPPAAAITTDDLLPIVDSPGGVPVTQRATFAQLVTLLNTIYAPITGGAYVLKAGDTMTGPLLFSPDNTVDIGASGATRARTGYFGTSLVTALLASPAATALSFASAGTTRANFSTSGHFLFNTDNTNDIGASLATRPRNLYIAGTAAIGSTLSSGGSLVLVAGADIQVTSRINIDWPSDGVMRIRDAAGTSFGRLQFGGTTSAFPSIKRSAATLQARLADDSAFANVSVNNVLANNAATLITSSVAMTDGAAAALGTLTNAPTAGNPALWCPVLINGATRFIPMWA